MTVRIDKQALMDSLPGVDGASRLVEKALENGQQHLFEDWDERDSEYRETLLRELGRIDWDIVAEARRMLSGEKKPVEHDDSEILPVPMRTMREQEPHRQEEWELGREALINGRVAWLVPAGGSGSRLVKVLQEIYDSLPFKRRYKVADEQMRHFDQDSAKGQLPISPVLGKTFYGLFMEQALALGARVNRMPVLMFMLSDQTREASLTTITTHQLYKDLKKAVVLFDHGMNPVLDEEGRIIRQDDSGHLVFSGNGNGGMFKALQDTAFRSEESIFGWLEKEGVEVVGFSNVDNPVADIILPHMVGSHERLEVELTFGVVEKKDPFERVGMIVRIAGEPNLDKIEYNVFPESLAAKKNPDDPGRLLYEHGDVNVFLMGLDSMEKVESLPLCMYRNKQVKTQWGRENGVKFESFAFHMIQQVPSENVDVKQILRRDQFMPTKNSVGRDSPATVIRAWCTRNMRWLEEQGAKVAKQDLESAIEDYRELCEKRLAPASEGTGLEERAAEITALAGAMLAGGEEMSHERLFDACLELGRLADEAGHGKLKLACDHAYSILQPGEARAFVEFSPCFALEKEDLAEMFLGEGWELGRGCQVALTGHPTQVMMGENFRVGRDAVFILDIRNEYGDISLSDDRWFTFELDRAGKADIGEDVTIADGAIVEVHVHGSGRLVIPDGATIEGEHLVEIADGEEVTLGG